MQLKRRDLLNLSSIKVRQDCPTSSAVPKGVAKTRTFWFAKHWQTVALSRQCAFRAMLCVPLLHL